jgi:hypothetical protein
MSAFGPGADWLRNIETTPNPEVVIGSQRFVAAHRVLDEEEAVRVITGYEQRNRLIAPIIRWVLSRLLGWHYDRCMEHRRRLVAQLPFIAFRPAVMLRPIPRGLAQAGAHSLPHHKIGITRLSARDLGSRHFGPSPI